MSIALTTEDIKELVKASLGPLPTVCQEQVLLDMERARMATEDGLAAAEKKRKREQEENKRLDRDKNRRLTAIREVMLDGRFNNNQKFGFTIRTLTEILDDGEVEQDDDAERQVYEELTGRFLR